MPKKCPSIVGIDVSLTHTAMWFGEGNFTSVKGGKMRGVTRLKAMYEWVLAALVTNKPNVAVIEGYAYMANSRQHRLGEIGGVVRLACANSGVKRVIEVPPTTLKKFFFGHGRATKEEMIDEANRRVGPDFKITDDNIADSLALWCAGLDNALIRGKCETENLDE